MEMTWLRRRPAWIAASLARSCVLSCIWRTLLDWCEMDAAGRKELNWARQGGTDSRDQHTVLTTSAQDMVSLVSSSG